MHGHTIADDGDELRHGQFFRHEEFRLVQSGQVQFLLKSLDDDGNFVGEFDSDAGRFFQTGFQRFAHFKRQMAGGRVTGSGGVGVEQARRLDDRQHERGHRRDRGVSVNGRVERREICGKVGERRK